METASNRSRNVQSFRLCYVVINDARCLETGMADDSDSEGHTVEQQNKSELLAYFQVNCVHRYECVQVFYLLCTY